MNLLIVFTLIGVWELCKLGTLAEIVRGASPRPIQDSKWFDNTSDVGWLRISDVTEQNGRIYKLEQKLSKAGQEKTRVLRKPHLLLSIAATVGKPVVNYVNTGVHDGFLIFLNPLFDREFMFQWLEMFTPKWQKYGQPGSQLNLNSELVRNQELRMPSTNEQEKIGMLFQYLDDTITLHQRKLDQLKELKKAYLQLMFPKKDETVPRVRFADFEDDWQLCKLGETFSIIMGQSPNSENYTENPDDYILVQGNSDMKNNKVVPRIWTTQVTKKAEKGDLILSVRAPVGEIGKTDYNVVLGRGVAAVKGNDFIFQQLRKMKDSGYWTRYSTGSTFESINSNDIKEALINIPNKDEQQKIGDLFTHLDDAIILNQNKLNQLKSLKKSYLQNMFI
ncbi:restriction endonuclease subunit S [Enterococcus faecalis]|nr:restriction endonuclease subunit S [Enterococcus faecalis]QTI52457.1 restriction endonuclease subunit S [Enterococcus faecalis]